MVLSILDGKVIYTRVSPQTLWVRTYNENIQRSSNMNQELNIKSSTGNKVGEILIKLGEEEFEKERALLAEVGINVTSETDVRVFIQHFNEILMGSKQYKAALNRLNAALSETYQNPQYRAPTIASLFTGYLQTALAENINHFIENNREDLIHKNFTLWIKELENIVNNSIDLAWDRMMGLKPGKTKRTSKEVQLYGYKKDWKEVGKAAQNMYESIDQFSKYFKEMLWSKFDFKKHLSVLFENSKINLTDPSKSTGISTILGEGAIEKDVVNPGGLGLRASTTSRTKGGSVEEFIMQILETMGSAVQTAAEKGGYGTRVFQPEKMLIDSAMLLEFSANINSESAAQEIIDRMNEALKGNTTLNDAAKKLQEYYDQYLSKLDDSFIIYNSTKSYTMSSSFEGFEATRERALSSLPELLSEARINYSKTAIEQFIYTAYNTATGAIFSYQREKVIQELKEALLVAMSSLLFDDWKTIGAQTGGAKAIHVLQLEGLNLPLSVLLKATGQAIDDVEQDTESFFKTSIHLLSKVEHDEEPFQADTLDEVKKEWERQAQIAAGQSSFTISFLANFKTIISKWI